MNCPFGEQKVPTVPFWPRMGIKGCIHSYCSNSPTCHTCLSGSPTMRPLIGGGGREHGTTTNGKGYGSVNKNGLLKIKKIPIPGILVLLFFIK